MLYLKIVTSSEFISITLTICVYNVQEKWDKNTTKIKKIEQEFYYELSPVEKKQYQNYIILSTSFNRQLSPYASCPKRGCKRCRNTDPLLVVLSETCEDADRRQSQIVIFLVHQLLESCNSVAPEDLVGPGLLPR